MLKVGGVIKMTPVILLM